MRLGQMALNRHQYEHPILIFNFSDLTAVRQEIIKEYGLPICSS